MVRLSVVLLCYHTSSRDKATSAKTHLFGWNCTFSLRNWAFHFACTTTALADSLA